MQVTLYGWSKSFIGIYMYILCIYACDNNEIAGHDLKESGGVGKIYESVWEQKGEGSNVGIIL